MVQGGNGTGIAALLKRAYMFLEDGEWSQANEYCERVLDQDPENAEAYLAKLMAELCIRKRSQLKDADEPFGDKNSCIKACRFGDVSLKQELEDANKFILQRNETARLDRLYVEAKTTMDTAGSEADFLAAAKQFDVVAHYKDAAAQAKKCVDLAEECAETQRDDRYNNAEGLEKIGSMASLKKAAAEFEALGDYKDAKAHAETVQCKLDVLKAQQSVKRKKIGIVAGAAIVAVIAAVLIVTQVVMPAKEKAEFEAAHVTNGALQKASVGDTVYLGAYEQDNDTSNGKEEIEWRVLAIENGEALLISEYGLDAHRFNDSTSKGNDWDTCDLKAWLQGEFAQDAGLSDVASSLTCLSIDEAKKYFSSDDDRLCAPTAYAVAQGASQSSSYKVDGVGACPWWLRSAGSSSDSAVGVGVGGYVSRSGYDGESYCAVRPALWINL